MNKLWGSLARGFGGRFPTPFSKQPTSQRYDESEEEVNNEVARNFNTTHILSAGDSQFCLTSRAFDKNGCSNDGKTRNQENRKHIMYKILDGFTWTTATAFMLQVGRAVSGSTLRKRNTQDGENDERVKQKVVQSGLLKLHELAFSQALMKDVLLHVLPRTTKAYAAGGAGQQVGTSVHRTVASTPPPTVTPITANRCDDQNRPEQCGSWDGSSSEELLETFSTSTQHCMGMSYNIQGIKHLNDGKRPEAFESFKSGAEQGYDKAHYNLALCYHFGTGTPACRDKAIAEYKRAARHGHKVAQYNLAVLFLDNEQRDMVSEARALLLLEQAAQQGLVQAQSKLGVHLAVPGPHHDMRKAVRMFTLASQQQDALATYNLAQCYEHGLGGVDTDARKAYDLYTTSADDGNSDAMFKMASILATGCAGGSWLDFAVFAASFCSAFIVVTLINTCGVRQNRDLAQQIFKRAAQAGHAGAAVRYRQLAVPQLPSTGHRYFKRGASASVNVSDSILRELLFSLPCGQVPTGGGKVAPSVSGGSDQAIHRVATWPSMPAEHVGLTREVR